MRGVLGSPRLVGVLVAACFVATTAGCRDKKKARIDVDETTATEDTKDVTPLDGVSEDGIKLAQVASFTGSQAGLGTELYRGAMAYFLDVNARGGFNGRKVSIVPIDDKYTTEGGEAGAERALNEEKVFQFFAASGTEPSAGILKVAKKYEDKKIFMWGSSSPAEVSREGPLAPFAFNIRGSVKALARDISSTFADNGFKKVGIIVQDNAFGKSCGNAAKKAAEEKGLQVVAEGSITSAARPEDATKNSLDVLKQMKNAGAEAIYLGMTYNPASVVVRDAREQQWDVPLAVMGTPDTMVRWLVAHEKKTGKRMTNAVACASFVPPVSAVDFRAVREYRDLMDKRNPQLPTEVADPNYRPLRYSSSSLEGYLMARVFGEALERAGKNLTRESIRKAAESIQNWDPGLGATITFGPNDNQGLDNVWLAGIDNDELALEPDMKRYLTTKGGGQPLPKAGEKSADAGPHTAGASSGIGAAGAVTKGPGKTPDRK